MAGNLSYKVTGNGVPVVFLHGFMECSTMWEYIAVDKLPFRSLCFDLPGHGASSLEDSEEPPSIEHFSEKVKECLDDLSLTLYHVVGHSMGGYVALNLKESDPRCKKVVLLNSNFWEDSEQKKRDRIRMADLAFKSKDLLIRNAIPGLFARPHAYQTGMNALLEEALHLAPEAIAYAALAMRDRKNKFQLMRKYTDDFLLLHGALDPLITQELLEAHLEDLNISVTLLEDAGHMAHMEEPTAVFSLLVNFLS
jgi:2-succinyl-6-hydroxy-2,4-cyclohexadiene-1-carboxylate synthase